MSARSKINGVASLTPHQIPDIATSRVLSLDLGRRTGLCLSYDGKVVDSGVHELYSEREKDFTDAQRFLAFHQLLLGYTDVDVVVFEALGGGTKGRQTTLWNGYRAVLLLWAQMIGKPVVPVSVGAIKKAVTGSGRASKDEMMEGVRKKGFPVFDDNEADAIGAFWAACAIDIAPQVVHDAPKVKRKRKVSRKSKADATKPKAKPATRKRPAAKRKRPARPRKSSRA